MNIGPFLIAPGGWIAPHRVNREFRNWRWVLSWTRSGTDLCGLTYIGALVVLGFSFHLWRRAPK